VTTRRSLLALFPGLGEAKLIVPVFSPVVLNVRLGVPVADAFSVVSVESYLETLILVSWTLALATVTSRYHVKVPLCQSRKFGNVVAE
jgi:hypothetical protein